MEHEIFPLLPVIGKATPFRGIGEFFYFIGSLVCLGFIVLWTLRKLLIDLYWRWRDRR